MGESKAIEEMDKHFFLLQIIGMAETWLDSLKSPFLEKEFGEIIFKFSVQNGKIKRFCPQWEESQKT